MVSTNGANQFVSTVIRDVAGNATIAVVSGINIDKTAPEIAVQINPRTLEAEVVRQGSAGILTPVSVVAGRWTRDDDGDESSGPAQLRTYRITDGAGNSTTVVVKVRLQSQHARARIVSVQYSGGPVQTLPRGAVHLERDDPGEIEQRAVLWRAGTIEQLVTAAWQSTRNTTDLTIRPPLPARRETRLGYVALQLTTNRGAVAIEW